MMRIVVETTFAKTIIYPTAYAVDVVNTPHNDMLVISYSDNGADRVATYPMNRILRYTVSPMESDEDTTENLEEPEKTEI